MKRFFLAVFTGVVFFSAIPLQANEFLNTILHFNMGFLYTLGTTGDILDREKKYYLLKYPGDSTSKKVHPSHHETAFGLSVDLVPFKPIILGNEAHAIKIGLRGGYSFHYLQQSLTVDQGTGDIEYGGDLMTYNCWMLGPVIHYAPSIEPVGIGEYSAGGGFTFFALMGQLRNAKYNAYPTKRDYGETVTDYERNVKGWKFDIGCGAALAVCSINIGINLYYSLVSLKLNNALTQTEYVTMGRKSKIHEMCFELYWGIPIEWFADPEFF